MKAKEVVAFPIALFKAISVILIFNLRAKLPIKQASDNKIATGFDTLMGCAWIPRPKALTMGGRDDGMGAQLHGQMSIIAMARFFNIPYAHQNIEKANFVESSDEYLRWNRAFNFESSSDYQISENDRLIEVEQFVRWPFGSNRECILYARHLHRAAEKRTIAYNSICRDLAQNLNFDPEIETQDRPSEDGLTIALHVRRGDVGSAENSNRFTSIAFTKKSLDDMTSQLVQKGIPYRIELHSQGTKDHFVELLDEYEMTLYLDTDPLSTMKKLIEADILVTAKSSFSHIAAMLSDGIIFHLPFWHKPMEHWHLISQTGALDESAKNGFLLELEKHSSDSI